MLFYGKTDVGKRRAVNQDNFIVKKYSSDVLFAVVCDGMGGASGGNIASSLAIETFAGILDECEKRHPSFFGMSEEDILESLSEDDGGDGEDEEGEDAEKPETVDVTKTPKCFEELADIVASKRSGAIQYMKKSTGEVFSLREYHFRYAKVLGAVSMGREIAPTEYARITLAGEVLADIDAFYILPSLSDDEMAEAVIGFCDEKYGMNGKKYVKNPEKFIKLLKENGDLDDWKLYSKAATVEKLTEYCAENGIVFEEDEADE